MRQWSNRQWRVVDLYKNPARYLLIVGSPGAGKTAAGIAGYILWACDTFKQTRQFAVIAVTARQCEKVVLTEIQRFCKEHKLPFQRLSDKVYQVWRHQFVLFSAPNKQAARNLQGYNLAGFYIDEVVNIPEDVMYEINSRVRDGDTNKIVMTANAGSAAHWFYRDYVKEAEAIDMDIIELNLADNPNLSTDYVESIIKTSRGGWYKRRILNQWAPLSGVVYIMPDEYRGELDKEASSAWYLSVDPADSSSTHAILFGRWDGKFYSYAEWVWNHFNDGQLGHVEQVARLKEWIDGYDISLAGIIYDSATPNFGRLLFDSFQSPTMMAAKDVNEGVRVTQYCLDTGIITMTERTPIAFDQMVLYQWDETAAERGEDKPMKHNDHGPDAVRYFAMTVAMVA